MISRSKALVSLLLLSLSTSTAFADNINIPQLDDSSATIAKDVKLSDEANVKGIVVNRDGSPTTLIIGVSSSEPNNNLPRIGYLRDEQGNYAIASIHNLADGNKNSTSDNSKIIFNTGTVSNLFAGWAINTAGGNTSASNNSIEINGGIITQHDNGNTTGYIRAGFALSLGDSQNKNYSIADNNHIQINAARDIDSHIIGGEAIIGSQNSMNVFARANNNSIVVNGGGLHASVPSGYIIGGLVKATAKDNSNVELKNNIVTLGNVNLSDDSFVAASAYDINSPTSKLFAENNGIVVNENINDPKIQFYGVTPVTFDIANNTAIPVRNQPNNITLENVKNNYLTINSDSVNIKNIKNFNTINLHPKKLSVGNTPEEIKPILILADTETVDLSNTDIKVVLPENSDLTKLIKLIDTSNPNSKGINYTNAKFHVTKGSTIELDANLDSSNKFIKIDTTKKPRLLPITKILTQAPLASFAFVKNVPEVEMGRTNTFFNAYFDHMKYKAGSEIDNKGMHYNAGMRMSKNFIDYAIYLEHGNGNYTTNLDSGAFAKGNLKYTGLGVKAQKEISSNITGYANLRFGQSRMNFISSSFVDRQSFELKTPYYGISLGAKKVQPLKDNQEIVYDANYSYLHQGGKKANLTSGEEYNFKPISAHTLSIGGEYRYKLADGDYHFVKLTLSDVFGNNSVAQYDGMKTPSTSLNGFSTQIDLGMYKKFGDKLKTDISFGQSFGKKHGQIFNLDLSYKF